MEPVDWDLPLFWCGAHAGGAWVLLPPLLGEGRGGATLPLIRTLLLFEGRSREFAPAGDSLSFASPKESKQRKGDPTARVPPLRCGQPAVLASPACRRTRDVHCVHSAQTAAASQTTKHACPSAGVRPAALRSSAQPEGSGSGHRFARPPTASRSEAWTWSPSPRRLIWPACLQAKCRRPPAPHTRTRHGALKVQPLCACRGAQGRRPPACRRTGGLRCLTCRSCLSVVNEVNAASSAAGRLREHRRLPEAKRRDADSGVAFLWLLSLAKQRK
jgi:hypothetical protein